MRRKHPKDIVIVGLGLMGASLAKTLKKKFPKRRVLGLSRSIKTVRKARNLGILDGGGTSPEKVFQNAEIIIIATPVSQIQKFILKADKFAPKDTLVTDLGSTKEALFRWANKKKFKNIGYVGSHPLAGSHLSGLENAFDKLYLDATCFITLDLKTDTKQLERLTAFWKKVGSKICLITPEDHDALMAASSHFPHLLASGLVSFVQSASPDALSFAGTGFKDTTRIAAGLPEIWVDIFLSNKKNLLNQNQGFIKELQRLQKLLQKGNRAELLRYFKKVQKLRSELSS